MSMYSVRYQCTCPECGTVGAGDVGKRYFCHKCDDVIMLPSNNGVIIHNDMLKRVLEQTFITDCIENRNQDKLYAMHYLENGGDDFIEQMIEELWSNWSDNFPVEEKGKE